MAVTSPLLDIPNLHDGSLKGLDFGEDSVTARMTDWTGKPYVLQMSGVEEFRVSVGSRNLIGWLDIIQGKRPHKRFLRRLFGTPNPRFDQEVFQGEMADEMERSDRVRRSEAALVVLHGNFTVFFVGLCASASLREG